MGIGSQEERLRISHILVRIEKAGGVKTAPMKRTESCRAIYTIYYLVTKATVYYVYSMMYPRWRFVLIVVVALIAAIFFLM